LENALNAVEKNFAEVLTSGIGNHLDLPPGIEILPGARVAALIIQAALKRQESRGAHFREDFADQDDKNWQGHLQVKQSRDGQAHWNFQAVS
jgi:L-aspartate oxidase